MWHSLEITQLKKSSHIFRDILSILKYENLKFLVMLKNQIYHPF